MSYDELKKEFGKQAVQFIELRLERCSLTYGLAPCTAAIGTTGTKKCFNTFGTCQDQPNFASQPVKYRFSTTRLWTRGQGPQLTGEPPTFPTLVSVNTAPTVLTPGKGIGVRSSVQAVVQDHPWHDAFTDPYISSRSYKPDDQGSFWGKFLARNKYYQNRVLVVYTGFLDENGEYDPANFKQRTYIITKISGPGADGRVTIEGKDPLRLADNEKAKFPLPCTATLTTAINASHPHFDIADPDGQVAAQLSIGTLAQPYLVVDREIVRVTSWTISGTTVTATTTRASVPVYYDGTFNVAVSHGVGAKVQTTWNFDDQYAHDVVNKLLTDAAGLDPAYLPYSEWQTEILEAAPYMKFSRLIAQPTGVKDLLTEITQHGILLWWDERATVVRMRGMRFYGVLSDVLSDDKNFVANTVAVSEDPNSLATQVWMSYAHAAPLEDPKLLKSYRQISIPADLTEESANAFGRSQTMQIMSLWMPPSGASAVQSQTDIQLRQYKKVRKVINFTLDPKDDNYWVGDVISVSTHLVPDDEGALTPRNYLITSVDEVWSADGVMLRYVATEQFTFTRVGLIAPDSLASTTYSSATVDQRRQYAFITRDVGTFADGSPGYQIR